MVLHAYPFRSLASLLVPLAVLAACIYAVELHFPTVGPYQPPCGYSVQYHFGFNALNVFISGAALGTIQHWMFVRAGAYIPPAITSTLLVLLTVGACVVAGLEPSESYVCCLEF